MKYGAINKNHVSFELSQMRIVSMAPLRKPCNIVMSTSNLNCIPEIKKNKL